MKLKAEQDETNAVNDISVTIPESSSSPLKVNDGRPSDLECFIQPHEIKKGPIEKEKVDDKKIDMLKIDEQNLNSIKEGVDSGQAGSQDELVLNYDTLCAYIKTYHPQTMDT